EGARVAMCSRGEAIQAAAEEVRAATGAEVLALSADLRDGDACTRIVRETVDRFGRLDVLVNNAGGPPSGSVTEMTDEQWETAFQTNLMSAVRLCRAAVPHMRAAGGGRIINITSSGVRQPIPGLVLSNAIRAGIVNFAKTLATELGPEKILVNKVAPGRIATDRVRELDEAAAHRGGTAVEEVARSMAAAIPAGRYGEPEEFANLVVFLASARASYISGQTIMVDGGMVKGI
ncbi:MAG: SDR family oxidoreductase, partial [Chloroflexota bacterium]